MNNTKKWFVDIHGHKSIVNDKNGNMTRLPKPESWSEHYQLTYDAWNRLVEVKDDVSTVASYTYDGLNRRVKKLLPGETRLFYYNRNWQCLEETLNSTTDVQYIWGLRYIDDLVCQISDSETSYSLADTNWNVVALANSTGTVLERYTYNAFGARNIYDASFTPRPTTLYPHFTRTFTSQVLDPETGLMLYRNRHYHPTLGRFIQRDPIGYEDDRLNLHRYVYGNPVRWQGIRGTVVFTTGGLIIIGVVVVGSTVVGCGYCLSHWSQYKEDVKARMPTDAELNCMKNAYNFIGNVYKPLVDLEEGNNVYIMDVYDAPHVHRKCFAKAMFFPSRGMGSPDCSSCDSFIELVATIIHENVHWNGTADEYETYRQEYIGLHNLMMKCDQVSAPCTPVGCRKAIAEKQKIVFQTIIDIKKEMTKR